MVRPNVSQYVKSKETNEYPIPSFYFNVEVEGNDKGSKAKGSFTEVSGLTREIQTIDYRDGFTKSLVPRKIPGMPKFTNVTLKRGVFSQNLDFQNWLTSQKYNRIDRRTVTISLLDQDGNPLITWKLLKAYPVKIEGPTMKSDGSEVAMESMELVHEGFGVEHKN